MNISTKTIDVNGWQFIINQGGHVLTGDSGIVAVTGPIDLSDMVILVLNDNNVDIKSTFYDATVSVSTDKKVTVLFSEDTD